MKLKRYWFIIFPDNRFGPKNFGVSASSKEEAKELIIESINSLQQQLMTNLSDYTEVIEDIDIRLLDQEHVIPNMGAVTFKGVWFSEPKYEMSLYAPAYNKCIAGKWGLTEEQ